MSTSALNGIRVLDLTKLFPGPLCTRELVRMGATVIKVEDTFGGDPVKHIPPFIKGESYLYSELNSGKEPLFLNLKEEADYQKFLKEVKKAHVLVEGFLPGVTKRLKIDYEIIKSINPAIIYCSITGYGHESEWKERPAHDLNFMALSGLLESFRYSEDEDPIIPNFQMADICGGLMATIKILGALQSQKSNQEGSFIDLSLFNTLKDLPLPFYNDFLLRKNQKDDDKKFQKGTLTGKLASYNIYKTKDNKYMALAAYEKKFWAGFCKEIGREDLIETFGSDAKKQQEVIQVLREIFTTKSQEEWSDLLENKQICCTPLKELDSIEQIKK